MKGRTFSPTKVIAPLIRLPIALLMLPICLYAFGGQVAMGRLLGDSTDEGLDARTSYHFLAAMFGSLMFWPLLTILAVWLAVNNASSLTDLIGFDWLAVYGESQMHTLLAIGTLALSLLPIYWFSGRVWSKFWDDLVDFKRFLLRMNTRGAQRQNIRGALKNLHGEMDKMSL